MLRRLHRIDLQPIRKAPPRTSDYAESQGLRGLV
jgi:hypothetical protein